MRTPSTAAALALLATVASAQVLNPTAFPLAGGPREPHAADLDDDGDLDLVVALEEADEIAVFLNEAGSLGAPFFLEAGRVPSSIASGDVNEDGHVDLVVANANGAAASTFLGDGGGAFVAGPSVPASHAYQVELGDLTGNGTLDLVAATPSGHLLFLEGAGDGTFALALDEHVGGNIIHFTLAHVDGDALLDVVVAAYLGGTPVYLNAGAFAFDQTFVGLSFGASSEWVAVADIDENGTTDVAFIEADAFDTCPMARPGNGDGTFGQWLVVELEFAHFDRIEFGRVDSDDDPDALSVFGSGLRLRFGGDGASFLGSEKEDHFLDGAISGLVAADLNGDGLDEVVATVAETGQLVVFANELCSSTPIVDEVTPPLVPALADPPAQVAVLGCGLQSVEGVVVAGQSLSPEEFVVEDTTSLVLEVPPAPSLGAASVLLQSPLGNAAALIEYVAPSEPLLVLGNDGALVDGVVTPLRVGSEPNDFVLLFVSPALVPSSAPGLVDLAIGDAFGSLFLLASFPIPAPAWTQLDLAFSGLPAGLEVHFQGAVLSAANPVPPLAVTNPVTGVTVP